MSSFRELKPIGNPPLSPPEPDPRMIVVCEGCGLDIHIDYADELGDFGYFVCDGEYGCLREFTEYLIAQNNSLRSENRKLRSANG